MQSTTNTNSNQMKPEDRRERTTPGGEPWTGLSALTVDDLADLQWICAPKFAKNGRRPRNPVVQANATH
jgi:hypothetical protein